jgi:hypothetical protein
MKERELNLLCVNNHYSDPKLTLTPLFTLPHSHVELKRREEDLKKKEVLLKAREAALLAREEELIKRETALGVGAEGGVSLFTGWEGSSAVSTPASVSSTSSSQRTLSLSSAASTYSSGTVSTAETPHGTAGVIEDTENMYHVPIERLSLHCGKYQVAVLGCNRANSYLLLFKSQQANSSNRYPHNRAMTEKYAHH